METTKPHHGHKWMPVMYGSFFGLMQAAAHKHGYALALHGSLTRDMDLIAVPWIDTASQPLDLLAELFKVIGWERSDGVPYHGEPEQKPHGRTAYIIHTGGGGYVDISIMPLSSAPLLSH
jgi:hypothetical protein